MNAEKSVQLPHPAPAGVKIYYWYGGLLLLARTLVLQRPTRPIAATLRIALRQPYQIEVEDSVLTTWASLVGAKQCRKRIIAVESDLALFYFPTEWPSYAKLRRHINEPLVELELEKFADILPRLRDAFDANLSGAEIKALAHDALDIIVDPEDDQGGIDPRIRKACSIIAWTPLNEFHLEDIARQTNLSPSRLRSLFKEQIGHSISNYARWSATWQSVTLWGPNRSWTESELDRCGDGCRLF